jgi:hypothetical protein
MLVVYKPFKMINAGKVQTGLRERCADHRVGGKKKGENEEGEKGKEMR